MASLRKLEIKFPLWSYGFRPSCPYVDLMKQTYKLHFDFLDRIEISLIVLNVAFFEEFPFQRNMVYEELLDLPDCFKVIEYFGRIIRNSV
jgi:hypothetical protein